MAIDAEGNIFLSNGYNSVFCFNFELDLIWTDNISDVGGPALSSNGHLIFPAEGHVIKVYEGRGISCLMHPVTFYVHNQYNTPLQNVEIIIGEESKTTDEYGEVIFDLEEGEISYTAIYNTVEISGNYTVTSDANQTVDIEFIVTSTNDIKIENGIYPNPTNGVFTIDLPNIGQSNITITDISGEIIFDQHYSTNKKQVIDLSNQASGVYFIEIRSENSLHTEKIIIK